MQATHITESLFNYQFVTAWTSEKYLAVQSGFNIHYPYCNKAATSIELLHKISC